MDGSPGTQIDPLTLVLPRPSSSSSLQRPHRPRRHRDRARRSPRSSMRRPCRHDRRPFAPATGLWEPLANWIAALELTYMEPRTIEDSDMTATHARTTSSSLLPSARPSAASSVHSPPSPAHELGRIAIEAALEQAGVVDGEDVSEVILGQVLTAAQGQNPARQASMAAGVPKEIPAWGVNQVCGSGPPRGRARVHRRSRPATRPSSSPAARNRCRFPRTRSRSAAGRRWVISASSTRWSATA